MGEKFDPIQRVGIYIPGGTAPLASTALMTITLAKVAGCKEIVACTPSTNADLLYAIGVAGATEVYRIGGAQAIAALALGTATIRPVLKVFGPGNAYVTAAKKLLFGQVAVDLLAGPSELLVLADDTADPRLVAADTVKLLTSRMPPPASFTSTSKCLSPLRKMRRDVSFPAIQVTSSGVSSR